MAHSKAQWTLVASEPEDAPTYDRRTADFVSTQKTGVRGQLDSLTRWRVRHSLLGWKFGVQLGLLLTIAILIINIATVAAVISLRSMDSMGKASVTQGDCRSIKRYNTVYHLFINVMSTLLIGASNYTMQMLSAPTRSEIDAAHAKGSWLDIGVPSWRNLKQINKARVTLWIILSLSSLPLHLFFNSAVFVTLYQHGYHVTQIAPNFLHANLTAAYDATDLNNLIGSSPYSVLDLQQYATNGTLTKVDNINCINEVMVPLNTENLLYLLVTTGDPNKPYNTSDLQYEVFVDTQHFIPSDIEGGWITEPGDWACNQLNLTSDQACSPQKSGITKNQASNWQPYGIPIDYCLNLRAKDQCALEFSVPIMAIIIIMNAVKVIMFAFIAFVFSESPLVTLGDAIATFINRPSSSVSHVVVDPAKAATTTLLSNRSKPTRRWTATTKRRWFFCFLALAIAEFLVIFWLIFAAIATRRGIAIFDVPLGTVDPKTIIYSWSVPSIGIAGVVANALIANIAQPVLSAIYFAFNGLITAMCSANEWNCYSLEMKGLRVSSVPAGAQRSTHFLQLPYRYGAPLMVISILTHWMVSQAIYVVSVLNDGDRNLKGIAMEYPYYISCGYSPPAIVGVIVLGLSILVYAVSIGSVKLKAHEMPVAGSNSMLIEKQCVLEEQQYGLETKRLQWGIRRSAKMENEWVAGFSDMPVNGGERELDPIQRSGYVGVAS